MSRTQASPQPIVLLAESSADAAEAWRRCLRGLDVDLVIAPTAKDALAWLAQGGRPAVIVAAERLADAAGLTLLKSGVAQAPRARPVLLAASEQLSLSVAGLSFLAVVPIPPTKECLQAAICAAMASGGPLV